MGLQGLTQVEPVFPTAKSIKPMLDVIVRISPTPSGTARIAVNVAMLKRMLASPSGALCPRMNDYIGLQAKMDAIKRNSPAYHIGAVYLCGERADFNDEEHERLLGRVGTWGAVNMPSSTLMRSPHLSSYETKEDYDIQYRTFCQQFVRSQRIQFRRLLTQVTGGQMRIDPSYEALCEEIGTPQNEDVALLIEQINARPGDQQGEMFIDDEA